MYQPTSASPTDAMRRVMRAVSAGYLPVSRELRYDGIGIEIRAFTPADWGAYRLWDGSRDEPTRTVTALNVHTGQWESRTTAVSWWHDIRQTWLYVEPLDSRCVVCGDPVLGGAARHEDCTPRVVSTR